MSSRREPSVLVFREAYDDESDDELVVIPGYGGRFRRLHGSKQDGMRTPRAREHNAMAKERQQQKFTKFSLKVPRVKRSDTQSVADGDHVRPDSEEQTRPGGRAGAHLEGAELEQESVVSEEQTGLEGHASADVGSEEVEHGEVSSEDAATSALRACLGLVTGAVSVGFGYRVMFVAFVATLVGVLITKACNPSQEHHDGSIASPKASDPSQDQSATPDQCPLDEADNALPSVRLNDHTKLMANTRGFLLALFAELDDSDQDQNHSSSPKASGSSQDQSATIDQCSQDQADSAHPGAVLTDSSQEETHTTNLKASHSSQDRSTTVDQYSQSRVDSARSGVEVNDSYSSQEQNHSSVASSQSSNWSLDLVDDTEPESPQDSAYRSSESSGSPHEQNHSSVASSQGSTWSLDLVDDARTESPQDSVYGSSGSSGSSQKRSSSSSSSSKASDSTDDQQYSASSNGESSGSSQKQSHSSGSSSRTSISSSSSVQVSEDGSNSDDKTGHSAPDLCFSSDSVITVRKDDSRRNSEAPNLIPSTGDNATNAEPQPQSDADAEAEAEFMAKIARFELPNGPPPLVLNYEALKHVATYFLPGTHGACIDITKVWGGSFHEIRILTFEDGWTCIGRFTSLYEPLFKTESELATIAYVRKHTQIPVPQIYFVNHDQNHAVGSAFVLMERMEGVRLSDIWRDLSMEHRMSVISQLAHVVGQLADLRFDCIGSLTSDGTVGPLVNISYTQEKTLAGPFNSFLEFACATLDGNRRQDSEEVLAIYPAAKDALQEYLAHADVDVDSMLQAPYRLIHIDLEDRNIMVTRHSEHHAPKISGIIDWDNAFVGPCYYLYEHPGMITDLQMSDEELPDLKKLRKHFVKTLLRRSPEHSTERELVKRCFRKKTVELTKLLTFSKFARESDSVFSLLRTYVHSFDPDAGFGLHHPYDGFDNDWVPDSDSESDG